MGRPDLSSIPLRLDAPFVGRDEELRAWSAAIEETRSGRAIVTAVWSDSGLGRSALLSQFHRRFERQWPEGWILSAACRRGPQAASTPFQAMVTPIEQLGHGLARLSTKQADVLLPRRSFDLPTLFPFLAETGDGTPWLSQTPLLNHRDPRPLRELLDRIAARFPLALILDDAQWADAETLRLIRDLIRCPDPPAMLILLGLDTQETGLGGIPDLLLARFESTSSLKSTDIQLPPLTAEEAVALAEQCLAPLPKGQRQIDSWISSAQGSPRWICRLANELIDLHDAAQSPSDGPHQLPSLTSYLDRRLTASSEPVDEIRRLADRILSILAIGGPRPVDVVRRATVGKAPSADLDASFDEALDKLRDEDLARLGSSRLDRVYLVDELISDAAKRRIDPGVLPALYRGLAEGLRATEPDEMELVQFLIRGQRPEAAAEVAIAGARKAAAQKDLEAAVDLLQMAMEQLPETPDELAVTLHHTLAEALDRLGADHLAAEHYLITVDTMARIDTAGGASAGGASAGGASACDLKRRAADRLLISGLVDEGLKLLTPLLDQHGLAHLTSDRPFGLSRRWAYRCRLWCWELLSRRRPEEKVAAEDLQRIDLVFSLCRALGITHSGTWRQASLEHLILALKAGEPYRLSRALSLETVYSAYGGQSQEARVLQLSHRAVGLAREVGRPHARGLAQAMIGEAWTAMGEWRRALVALDRAERILESECPQAWWERRTAFFMQLRCLAMMGRMRDVKHSYQQALDAQSPYGSPFLERALESRFRWLVYLIDDRPEEAIDHLDAGIERRDDYSLPSYWQLFGWIESMIYYQQADDAWSWLEGNWSAVIEVRLGHIELIDIEIWFLRARACLARVQQSVCDHQTLEKMLSNADQAQDALRRTGALWADACHWSIRAGLAGFRGDRDTAAADLERAAERFDEARMGLHALCCRYQGRRLANDDDLSDLDADIVNLGLTNPERWADLLVPGLWWSRSDV